jgi:hypothetical protein
MDLNTFSLGGRFAYCFDCIAMIRDGKLFICFALLLNFGFSCKFNRRFVRSLAVFVPTSIYLIIPSTIRHKLKLVDVEGQMLRTSLRPFNSRKEDPLP